MFTPKGSEVLLFKACKVQTYLILYTHLHQSREEICERKAYVYIFFYLLKEFDLGMEITKTRHLCYRTMLPMFRFDSTEQPPFLEFMRTLSSLCDW